MHHKNTPQNFGGVELPYKKPWFTLVELIIVITILAILATIAFISFENYTKGARDGNRVTTLKNIETWLQLYAIKNASYPTPDEAVEISSGTTTLIHQWIVWPNTSQSIKLNQEVLDPKDHQNYLYSTTQNNTYYQLGTYLEENTLLWYFPTTYASTTEIDYTNRYFYTIGNKVWILLDDVNKTPVSKTTYPTGNLDLGGSLTGYTIYVSNDVKSKTLSGSDLIQEIVARQQTNDTIWNCWDFVFAGWETYTTKLWADGKCWTSQNMRHGTMLAGPTSPSNDNVIEKWCYNNDSVNCTNEWWLYTWSEAMWFPANCNSTGCTQWEDLTKSVCWALWNGWHLPSDSEWYALENASKNSWASCNKERVWYDSFECDWAGVLGNRLSWVISTLPGDRSIGGKYYNKGTDSYLWGSMGNNTSNWLARHIWSTKGGVRRDFFSASWLWFSIVCIKN